MSSFSIVSTIRPGYAAKMASGTVMNAARTTPAAASRHRSGRRATSRLAAAAYPAQAAVNSAAREPASQKAAPATSVAAAAGGRAPRRANVSPTPTRVVMRKYEPVALTSLM